MTKANITVYLQALGGKFLGPNAYNTNDIKLTLTLGGNTVSIPYKYVTGENDGSVGSSFQTPPANELSSFLPILTPVPVPPNTSSPAVDYLTPIGGTISGKIEVDVSQLEVLGTLSASIPRPGGEDLIVTQSIALNQMQSNYRAIMIVPGLLLEKPPTSEVLPIPTGLYLMVKMMCGCPITTGIGNSFWAASDFDVSAQVFFKNGTTITKGLTFAGNATPSLYVVPGVVASEVHMANYTAIQNSTGNVGFLSVIYSVC
jgi:hypothetical protein